MSAGKAAIRILRLLESKKIEAIDLLVTEESARIDTSAGKIIIDYEKKQKKYNVKVERDRLYLGVDSCTEDEIESTIEFLLKEFSRLVK